MSLLTSRVAEIRQILAADQRSGKVDPQDDQVWELTTGQGEPPALALQTTYGLRAYGIRVFPRFVIKKTPICDPRSFVLPPKITFSAPDFATINYSPLESIDVVQKIWVPDSHTLVGQVTLTNQSENLIQMGMEWVVLLNPLVAGSTMNASQISVNTVLQGQSQHLFPVFFLTGGPQSSNSALPGLTIELTFPPHSHRQFSWALASLQSTDASFYAARKSSAYSLDHVQIRSEMQQKQQNIDFQFEDFSLNGLMKQNQSKVFQLFMPPTQKLKFISYVDQRHPDHGFSASEAETYGSNHEIQRMIDLWSFSRVLLPFATSIEEELFLNFLDHQANDGTIFAQLGRQGPISNLPAAPLLTSIAFELFDQTNDIQWLRKVFPALLRAFQSWFTLRNDTDEDGFPEWMHALQTGLTESVNLSDLDQMRLSLLVLNAECPSLAAMMWNECNLLLRIASLIEEETETPWLKSKLDQLTALLQECWDEPSACFQPRDKKSHHHHKGKILHCFKQDGGCETFPPKMPASRILFRFAPRDGSSRQVECHIKGVVKHHERRIVFNTRNFQRVGDLWYMLSEEYFSDIKQINVTGLKKGDVFSVELPDFSATEADLIVPLWAGFADKNQSIALIKETAKKIEALQNELPFHLKIMWIEGLFRYEQHRTAVRYFKQWFFQPDEIKISSGVNITKLIPVTTLLQLLGIKKITEDEVVLTGFNHHIPQVNVQYKRFLIVTQDQQTRIENLNGENIVITEEGSHRIVLS